MLGVIFLLSRFPDSLFVFRFLQLNSNVFSLWISLSSPFLMLGEPFEYTDSYFSFMCILVFFCIVPQSLRFCLFLFRLVSLLFSDWMILTNLSWNLLFGCLIVFFRPLLSQIFHFVLFGSGISVQFLLIISISFLISFYKEIFFCFSLVIWPWFSIALKIHLRPLI